jgi:hypothetical protein
MANDKASIELKESLENSDPNAMTPELAEALRNYVPGSPEEKQLLRKIDLFLMPMLWIMYILNYIDRTNIVSALHEARHNHNVHDLSVTGKCNDRRNG